MQREIKSFLITLTIADLGPADGPEVPNEFRLTDQEVERLATRLKELLPALYEKLVALRECEVSEWLLDLF